MSFLLLRNYYPKVLQNSNSAFGHKKSRTRRHGFHLSENQKLFCNLDFFIVCYQFAIVNSVD